MNKILITLFALFTLLPVQIAFSQTIDNPPINFELPTDVEPPLFTEATDMVVEATSGLGAIVTYQRPFVSDNVGIISGPTCLPEAGSTFALGTSTVTCTATDAEGNTGHTIFSIIVKDTTPPSITAPADIVIDVIDTSILTLGVPTVSDIVDPFPVISNDLTTLVVGENIVTWTAIDFSGNPASAKQIVRFVNSIQIENDTLPSTEFVFEAVSPEGAKIDPFVIEISDPTQTDCQPALDAIFPLGQTALICKDNINSTLSFTITVKDTAPPIILASFVPIKVEEDEGIFEIEISSTDLVDQNPTITSELNGFPVTDGQIVKLEMDSETEIKHKTELLKFEGTSFVLSVVSSDFSGNTAILDISPQFETEEEELIELEIETLEEEAETLEEQIEDEIKAIEEEAETAEEGLEKEIKALEELLEDDDENQNAIKTQIENKKIEIEEIKKQKEASIENKKIEIEEIKKQKEKDELLANIHRELESVKSNELASLIASAVAILETDHSSQKTFEKLLEQKTFEKELQEQSETNTVSNREKIESIQVFNDLAVDELEELAKEKEELQKLELKQLEELLKNAEKLGELSLKEIEGLIKAELNEKENEIKNLAKLASSIIDENEKKQIEKEIENKKKEMEELKKQKKAEFEKQKDALEHQKKELEKALEAEKEQAEKQKTVFEKSIEKQKEMEEKAKQIEKELEEKKKGIEEKAKEAEKAAKEQEESNQSSNQSNNESNNSSSNQSSDSDDDEDDDDD